MRQPLMVMITTASAFSQCAARSQAGWIGPVASVMGTCRCNSGNRALVRAYRLQYAAAALALHKSDHLQPRAVPRGRQGDLALHPGCAGDEAYRPDPFAHH